VEADQHRQPPTGSVACASLGQRARSQAFYRLQLPKPSGSPRSYDIRIVPLVPALRLLRNEPGNSECVLAIIFIGFRTLTPRPVVIISVCRIHFVHDGARPFIVEGTRCLVRS